MLGVSCEWTLSSLQYVQKTSGDYSRGATTSGVGNPKGLTVEDACQVLIVNQGQVTEQLSFQGDSGGPAIQFQHGSMFNSFYLAQSSLPASPSTPAAPGATGADCRRWSAPRSRLEVDPNCNKMLMKTKKISIGAGFLEIIS